MLIVDKDFEIFQKGASKLGQMQKQKVDIELQEYTDYEKVVISYENFKKALKDLKTANWNFFFRYGTPMLFAPLISAVIKDLMNLKTSLIRDIFDSLEDSSTE